MDLCAILLYLIAIAGVLAVVGHGLWVMIGGIFHFLFGSNDDADAERRRRAERTERGRQVCAGCGCPFPRSASSCPECGLDPDDPRARELHKLEETARYLQSLVKDGGLDADLGDRVYSSLEARQQKLIKEATDRGRKRQPSHDVAADSSPFTTPDASAASHEAALAAQAICRELEERLADCRNVRDLPFETRKKVLGLYRRLHVQDLQNLSAGALLALGRIVRMAALSTRALEVYRALLLTHPNAAEAGTGALEGGLLAAHDAQWKLAVWFLEQALEHDLPANDRQEATELLGRLRRGMEDSLPATESHEPVPLSGTASEPMTAVVLDKDDRPTTAGSHRVPAASKVPEEPKRTLGQMLAGFMEERNILWGELVGGLLIVGCSIALVISLWRTLENIPYFPFLIMAALTWSMFGAGLYTLSHWKLEATSRGLLVIAVLLTPLGFLILAGLWRDQGSSGDWLGWATEAGGLLAYTFLVWRAGRVVAAPLQLGSPGGAPALLSLAVLGASATMLLIPRWIDSAQPAAGPFALLSFAPVLCFAVPLIPVLLQLSWRQRMDGATAKGLFVFLGLSAFAAGMAIGFLIHHGEDYRWTLLHLALPLAVAGAPLVVSGALLNLLLDREEQTAGEAQGAESGTGGAIAFEASGEIPQAGDVGLPLGLVRVIGTCIGLGGMAVMLSALVLAWPRPMSVMGIGFLNAAAFLLVALRYRIPYAQVPALFCLALACLIARCEIGGALIEQGMLTLDQAIDPANGPMLAILAAVLALSSELLLRLGRDRDGLCHVIGSAVLAGLALILVDRTMEVPRAAWVSAWCGFGALLANIRWRQPVLTVAASLVLLTACAFSILWLDPAMFVPQLWLLTLCILASAMTGAYLLLDWLWPRDESLRAAFIEPWRLLARVGSATAVLTMLPCLRWDLLPFCSGCAFWLAAIWLVISWKETWPGWFAACQLAVTAGVLLGTSSWLGQQTWVEKAEDLLHLWSIQVYLTALAGLSLVWLAVRFVLRNNPRAELLLSPRIALETGDVVQLAADREIFIGLTIGQFLLSAFAVLPSVVQELTPAGAAHVVTVPLDLNLAWSLLGMLALGWVMALWGWRGREAAAALLVVALSGSILAAESFRAEHAAASALRFSLGLCWLIGSALLWQRSRLLNLARRLRMSVPEDTDLAPLCRVLLLIVSVMPVLLITVVVANLGFTGRQPAGPGVGTIFQRLGWVANMVVPLGLVGVGLFGHGVREKAPRYIFSAGLVLLASVTGGYALGVVVGGGVIDETAGVFIAQLGALAAGGWALAWLLSGRWQNMALIGVQVVLAVLPTVVLLIAALGVIVVEPGQAMPAFVVQAGQAVGWLAFVLLGVISLWFVCKNAPDASVDVLAWGGILLGVQTACALAGLDQKNWLCYHVLVLAGTLLGLLLLSGSWIGGRATHLGPMFWPQERRANLALLLRQMLPTRRTQIWVDVLGAAVTLLAVRGAWEDPGRPYWSCLAVLAMAVLIGAQAVWVGRPAFVYVSGLLLNLAGYLGWQAWMIEEFGVRAWFAVGPGVVDTFLFVQILCLAAGSLAWSLVDWRLRLTVSPATGKPRDVRGDMMPYPHAAALLALHLLMMLVLVGVGSNLFDLGVHLDGWLAWSSLAATLLAVTVCWWDAEASLWGLPAGPTYLLGLTALGLALHQAVLQEVVPRTPWAIAWSVGVSLSIYMVLANGVIALAPSLHNLWRKLRLPSRAQDLLAGWYWPMQISLAAIVLVLSVWMCLYFVPLLERLGGPFGVGMLVMAGVLACRFAPSDKRPWVRIVVVSLAMVFVIEASWAVLDQHLPLQWLHRNALVLAVLTCSAGLLLSGKLPWNADWAACARRMGPTTAILAGVMLAEVLIQELLQYDRDPAVRRTLLAWPAFGFVLLLLMGLLVGLLWLAVSRRSPLAAVDRRRVYCVWAAELLAVVLVVHVRLGLPELFPGFLGRNWTFVVMALSFLGVGMAELFRRRGLPMLSEPLEHTGIFLPLLPLFVVLIGSSLKQLKWMEEHVTGLSPFFRYLDFLPRTAHEHAGLWFLLGVLYACVAVLRRNSTFALLAALAVNFGLWVIYASHHPFGFLLHPQLWLVPLGLILLTAEHVNRPHLTHAQSLAVRYIGLLLVYVSSTADLFIAGLGSVEYALVLALFSVAGVLLGILLRVRAFLFLGVTFLFLVVFSQIWHAAVDLEHTWVWWASGIALGAAILTLFALFEKRRNDLLRMIDELRQWR